MHDLLQQLGPARDGVSDGGGSLSVPGRGSAERHIGSQLQVIGRWQADRNATLQAAYEKVYPGRFPRHVRPGRAVERTAIPFADKFRPTPPSLQRSPS